METPPGLNFPIEGIRVETKSLFSIGAISIECTLGGLHQEFIFQASFRLG